MGMSMLSPLLQEALQLSHQGDTKASEIEALRRQIQFRDEFLEVRVHLYHGQFSG